MHLHIYIHINIHIHIAHIIYMHPAACMSYTMVFQSAQPPEPTPERSLCGAPCAPLQENRSTEPKSAGRDLRQGGAGCMLGRGCCAIEDLLLRDQIDDLRYTIPETFARYHVCNFSVWPLQISSERYGWQSLCRCVRGWSILPLQYSLHCCGSKKQLSM